MGTVNTLTGRGLRAFVLVLVLLVAGVMVCSRPTVVLAQEYEAMLPAELGREVRKAESEYRKIMDEVNAAENERIARGAAGAAEAELRALDAKLGALVTKAEKLKIHADYLEELYTAKQREYKNK